ncbi:threonine--tRNA ligase [Candidatus Pacearchaeota archaeon]|nr:threonine--tRNA ligase [Candidatus Pacearchaeota archaeon]
MKILTLHCDYIRFKAVKKAFKDAPEISEKEKEQHEVKECLVVLTSIEQGDSSETIKQLVEAVEKTAKEVKTENIVLYPYAHLSSNLAKPSLALELLKEAEVKLNKNFKHVYRAPFGYYKTFELKCKGHPLSELSKEFKNANSISTTGKLVEEKYDISKLLREINKTKLDTSKLKENDHRILAHKLDLFSFNEVAPGMIFWHDNGLYIYNKLTEMKRNLLKKYNYLEISTPQIFDSKLFKVSGHWEHYKENMFLTDYEKRQFGVKPMNCPGAMLVFKANKHSYREMPMRLAEFGIVHRQELSGVINGAFRVTRFTQDDSHIFCMPQQIGQEITTLLSMVNYIYKELFGFEYRLELSTRPEKFMGEIKDWDFAESELESVLKKMKMPFKINKGDGAFYGPKIDIHIKDSLGRSWQCATIQLDMQIPKRFEVSYIGEDSKEHTPIVIHCAVMGSIERFIGVLLEHTNGNLPLWLSPRQVRVVSFTDRNAKACEKFVKELREEFPNLRIDIDLSSETVQSKIRDAEMLKINYIIVIGDKEEENKTIAVRPRGGKPQFGIKVKDFTEKLKKELEI